MHRAPRRPRPREAYAPRLVALASLVVLTACSPRDQPMPGKGLGTFSVSAALGANTCGKGAGAPDPWTFAVQLSRDGSTLYWLQEGNQVSGTIDGAGNATIAGSLTGAGAGPDGGPTGCAMSRADTITVALGKAAAPTTVTGTIGFHFVADANPECALQLSSYGGAYDALPCDIPYTFTATRTKAP